jgi:hypothetical protein
MKTATLIDQDVSFVFLFQHSLVENTDVQDDF